MSYIFYRWTSASEEPTFTQLNTVHNVTLTLRSSKDPYVIGFTQVDLVKNSEDNTMLFWGLIIGVISLVSLIIPFRLIMTEDEFPSLPTREKQRFMRKV